MPEDGIWVSTLQTLKEKKLGLSTKQNHFLDITVSFNNKEVLENIFYAYKC